jgi:hypothetical protein
VLERALKQLTVDQSVEIVVMERSRLWLRALLNSVERGTLSGHVHVRLLLRHLGVARTVGAVGRVVV